MQSTAGELLVLDTDDFVGHLEKRRGWVLLRKRRAKEEGRVGVIEDHVRGTASKTLGFDIRLDKRRSTLWIRQL
jgi:hypothetical protein